MCAINVGISHYDNLIVSELGYIKIIAISFRESTSKARYHGLNLSISKHLVHRCLLDIENLTSYGKNSLCTSVSCRLCRTSGRISLNYEHLTLLRVTALTVGKLSVAVT